jgi:type VI protein secretion system component VasK
MTSERTMMKIFDSSPEIKLAQPRRRWALIAAAAATGAVVLALGGALVYQYQHFTAQLEKAKGELTTARAESAQLRTKLTDVKEKLDATTTESSSCSSNLAAETSKVAAFAKQAAACEVIRNQLNLKG